MTKKLGKHSLVTGVVEKPSVAGQIHHLDRDYLEKSASGHHESPEIAGGGIVLIVDDDQLQRDLARAVLIGLGFAGLEAKDGVEAVEVFQQHRNAIRFVLCDVIMPRMDGWETLAALRQLAPRIPVILSSGRDQAQVMAGDHSELPQVFLGKPYGITKLREAIRQALKDEVLSDYLQKIDSKAGECLLLT